MAKSIVVIPAGTSSLQPAPIPSAWVLKGTPETMNKELARSADRTAIVYDWSCTAGEFIWHYAEDEILVVVSGETFVTDEHGAEHRLGPGDMAFFPAGSSSNWRVTGHVRKFAMVRSTVPRPLVFLLRVFRRLKRLVAAPVPSPMTPALLGFAGNAWWTVLVA